MTEPVVVLRPIAESDLEELTRHSNDPVGLGEFEWWGYRDPRTWRRRWEEDGWISERHTNTALAVVTGDAVLAGFVNWREQSPGSNQQACFEIGILVFPDHRGRGIGTAAQRAVVEHLWATTQVHRIQASTEAGNIAEQRALEKVGFVLEGRMRESGFRAGRWRDGLMYGLLRPTAEQPDAE